MPTRSVEEIIASLRDKPVTRSFTIERDAPVDADARTVELAFASDQPIEHWFGMLSLSMDGKAMRTDRLDNGAAVLMDHDRRDVVGVVESHNTSKGVARAVVRFGEGQRASEIFTDVSTGIRRNVSVGFIVHEMHIENEKEAQKGAIPQYRSDDWEPFEISIVSVPADISVGVGREFDPTEAFSNPNAAEFRGNSALTEEIAMTPEEIAAQNAAAEEQRTLELAATRRRDVLAFADIYGERSLAEDLLLANPNAAQEDIRLAIVAKRAAAPAPPAIPHEDPADQAYRQGGVTQQSVQLARSLPRYGTLRNFTGQDAAERAHRFGQWILAMRGVSAGMSSEGAFKRSFDFCKANGIAVSRAMSEGVNESGGFLVPEEFGNDLIDLREQYGVFRRNAKIVPMASDSRSDPRRTGGLTAYFAGEGDAITASDKGWDRVNLAAEKLTCLARYSNEVNEDAVINMGDDLAGEIAYAFATKEDACGFIGDGSDTYGGMQGVTTKIKGLSGTIANIAGLTVATGTGYGTNYASIVLTDFEAVAGNLPVYADTARAKWYCHKNFYWNVMAKLVLAAGGTLGSEIEGSRTRRFLGYDVEFVQIMPKTSAVSQVCALLGDLSLAASFGSRRDTTIAVSEHSRFANDQLEIRGTERFDINVHDVGNASATAANRVAGPIVGLITAAS